MSSIVSCCLQDCNCSSKGSDCQGNCNPSNSDVTIPLCQGALLEYCSGADLPPDDASWISRWIDPNGSGAPIEQGCFNALQRNLFSFEASNYPLGPMGNCSIGPPNTPGTCTPANTGTVGPAGVTGNTSGYPLNSIGTAWATQLIKAAMAKYISNGFSIGALPGTIGYSPFQDFLHDYICCQYPTICASSLDKVCQTYTSKSLGLNPSAISWCGCHLPDSEYKNYIDKYQINKECTPMCNRSDNIAPVDSNGQPVTCKQGVCLIDNITIDLSKTQVSGGINIDQICGGCSGAATCSCIIENNSFIAANSSISGGINLQESCTSSTCTRTNPIPGDTPSVLNVPCSADPNYNPFAQQESQRQKELDSIRNQRTLLITIVFIISVVIILLILLWLQPR